MIVTNTPYESLSLNDILTPLLYIQKDNERTRDSYDNLIMQAEAFRNVVNQQTNPQAYNMFTNYMNDLDEASNLMNNRNYAQAKKMLSNLKRRYASEIGAIRDAKKALDETYEYEDRLRAKDNSVRMKNNYTIDSFLGGQRPEKEYISGTDLRKQVADEAERVASSIMSSPETSQVALGQLSVMVQRGYTPEQIFNFMNNENSVMYPELSAIMERIDDTIKDYSKEDKEYLRNMAMNGLMAGILAPTQKYIRDYQSAGGRGSGGSGSQYEKTTVYHYKGKGQELSKYEIDNRDMKNLGEGHLVYENGKSLLNENELELPQEVVLKIRQELGKLGSRDDVQIWAYPKEGKNKKKEYILEVRHLGNNNPYGQQQNDIQQTQQIENGYHFN